MADIEELRKKIQDVDNSLLTLLEQRVEYATQIGLLKKKENLPVYAPDIEKRKIDVLSKKCKYTGLVEVIWPVIMCYTRTIE
jgi:chorismate mutase/prephenate dehydratase